MDHLDDFLCDLQCEESDPTDFTPPCANCCNVNCSDCAFFSEN